MDSIDVEEESVLTAVFKDAFPGEVLLESLTIFQPLISVW